MPELPVGMHFSFAESDCGLFSRKWSVLGSVVIPRVSHHHGGKEQVLGLPPPPYSFLLFLLKLSRLLGHHGLCHTWHGPKRSFTAHMADTEQCWSSSCLELGLPG